MKRFIGQIISATIAIIIFSACSSTKTVTYFEDAEYISSESLSNVDTISDPIIRPGDLLNIDVTGSNMAVVAQFNRGRYVDADGKISSISRQYNNITGSSNLEQSTDYYLVNASGYIEFPIVGKIYASGLSKTQLAEKIASEIYPKYVTERPMVDIRLMNFRVTVAGAVKTPGVYQSKNERMTFLEAISMAGDLDIKGDRENILLYRTNADGTREVHRLNIHDSNFLLSPYFNLQQNDYIYVTPNKSMRQTAWQMNPAVTATITVFGGISSVASLVVGIINLTKD